MGTFEGTWGTLVVNTIKGSCFAANADLTVPPYTGSSFTLNMKINHNGEDETIGLAAVEHPGGTGFSINHLHSSGTSPNKRTYKGHVRKHQVTCNGVTTTSLIGFLGRDSLHTPVSAEDNGGIVDDSDTVSFTAVKTG